MNLLKKTLRQGLSLRTLNMMMLIAAIVISAILFWAMHNTREIYNETQSATQNLITLRKSAYNLQLASDYLTEQIRCFVLTGEKAYLDNYFEEAKVTKRRDNALLDLQKRHNNTIAFHNLSEAMEASVELMQDEYYAARLTVEAYGYDIDDYPEEIKNVVLSSWSVESSDEEKKVEAEETLFGTKYQKKKDYISSHMQSCLNELDTELEREQALVAGRLEHQVLVEHILTILLIIIMFLIVLLTTRLVIVPLQGCVDIIHEEKDIPVKGAYEIRFLAKTYNLMHHTNMQNREKLTYEATHDKLTGLYNRRGYDFLMENVELESSTLLLIDLDKFKQINDTYGHDVGDKILIKVSGLIFGSFRSQDYVCRLGGDEMAVIMVHTDRSLSKLISKKIQKINEQLKTENDDEGLPPISISVGAACGDDGITAEELFKKADEALYNTKENGRSSIRFS